MRSRCCLVHGCMTVTGCCLHRLIATQCVWTVESLHHYLKIILLLLFPKKSHQSPVWSPVGNDRQCWGKEHVKRNPWEAGKSQEWLHVTQPCLFTDTVDEENTSKTAEVRGGIGMCHPVTMCGPHLNYYSNCESKAELS